MSTFDPMKLFIVWDKKTFIDASKIVYDYDFRHSFKRYIGWFFVGLLQFGVVAAMKQGAVGLLVLATLGLVYWYGLRWPVRRWIISKNFTKEANVEMVVQEDGLHVDEKIILWEMIQRVVGFEKGFLVDYKKAAFFIPFSAYVSLEDRQRFAALIKDKVHMYHKI